MKSITLLFTVALISLSSLSYSQELTMFPGFFGTKYYQDAARVSRSEVELLIQTDQEANPLWQKAKQHKTVANIALFAEFGFLLWQVERAKNTDSQSGPFIGVIGAGIASIAYSLSANSLRKKAILKYNESQDIGNIHLGPTFNGVGVVVSF